MTDDESIHRENMLLRETLIAVRDDLKRSIADINTILREATALADLPAHEKETHDDGGTTG